MKGYKAKRSLWDLIGDTQPINVGKKSRASYLKSFLKISTLGISMAFLALSMQGPDTTGYRSLHADVNKNTNEQNLITDLTQDKTLSLLADSVQSSPDSGLSVNAVAAAPASGTVASLNANTDTHIQPSPTAIIISSPHSNPTPLPVKTPVNTPVPTPKPNPTPIPTPVPSPTPTPVSSGSCSVNDTHVNCGPTLSAAQIDAILSQAHSPIAGMGSYIYGLSVSSGVDDGFALAVWKEETQLCTLHFGLAPWDNCGDVRYAPNAPTVNGFAQYGSYQAGISDWFAHMDRVYLSKGLVTIEQIGPVYCPPSDNGGTSNWTPNVVTLTAYYRSQ